MKIPFNFIEKLNRLTNCEMNLILSLCTKKNNTGAVFGIRMSDYLDTMSKQSFYNAITGLADKGIIHFVHKKASGDYDIIILDCAISEEELKNNNVSYINLNRKLFESESFKKLTAKAKYLLLDLYKRTAVTITASGTKATAINYIQSFYEKYSRTMNVGKRRVREVLHDIKQFFNVKIKKATKGWKYIIGRNKATYDLDKKAGVSTKKHRHGFIKSMFRRYKLVAPDKVINDISKLYINYKPKNESIFEHHLEKAIFKHSLDNNKEVSPARVHQLLQIELGLVEEDN